MSIDPIYIIGGVLGGLIQLLLVTFCIVLVLKTKNTATILMLTGSILTILFYVLNIVWTSVMAYNGSEAIVKSVGLLNLLQIIPPAIFAIGFSLFVFKHVKKK